ncbi:MAG: tRNA (adenosine(37)-N6)-threonylcarbamoyltransferase complex transferase subunit TsaD [Rickettsiaceae bacterium]|nr:tRNA (adenosine(37)-N6)-threonylcarbamoyltransferase complex transferase subunit TsaD [Rickettsiaceae bacterium]
MLALGIESSCDDSAAAIVGFDKKIHANIVLSQVKEHMPYRGVVPEIASRAHMNYLDFAVKRALLEANIKLSDISCVAATGGPGLIGGVIVGTMYGKTISSVIKKPYIAVNHLEGHALTIRLCSDISFPYLLLLISGGHCQFVIVNNVRQYSIIGQTLDDAVGEAFDKVAKMLGLTYPGGPLVEEYAKKGDHKKFKLPLPLCDRAGADMSFSGLKTSVRNIIEAEKDICDQFIADICASFQDTIYKVLEFKIQEAMRIYEQKNAKKNIVIAGGVAANKYLSVGLANFVKTRGYKLHFPPGNLCTDNAAMIAWAGIENMKQGFKTNLNFCPMARWPLDTLDLDT